MLIHDIEPELAKVLSNPRLRRVPKGLGKLERQRWESWRLSTEVRYLPSPAEIDAAAEFIRQANEQAELSRGRQICRGE